MIGVGRWLLHEPEAALSFQSRPALLAVLGDPSAEGSRVIIATHSPLLAACPGAAIWEIGETGIEARNWTSWKLWRTGDPSWVIRIVSCVTCERHHMHR
ncbi:hypothetical protein OG921_11110 [Aldersonia sp. NBC_00410]|uniref:hypothetical protein n=1 Tax=Aldersonia sp. NBC_00410 TaxID=2975954 RepID=UPI00225B0325|nr:hypothetical protein [Aldersonia sp. NBC_00410]MCX5043714.1 hypothetical protein [Aldersonia sp. NBC_00410]